MMVLPQKCICKVRPDILKDLCMIDDCGPYLLTLIKGPVEVDELEGLKYEKMGICTWQPETIAPENILEQLHLGKEN